MTLKEKFGELGYKEDKFRPKVVELWVFQIVEGYEDECIEEGYVGEIRESEDELLSIDEELSGRHTSGIKFLSPTVFEVPVEVVNNSIDESLIPGLEEDPLINAHDLIQCPLEFEQPELRDASGRVGAAGEDGNGITFGLSEGGASLEIEIFRDRVGEERS
nr:hypothetical protein Iba_chr09bCG10090 [Ipomoea batatas]